MDSKAPWSDYKSSKSSSQRWLIIGAFIFLIVIIAVALTLKLLVFKTAGDEKFNTKANPSFRVESASFQITDLSGSQLSGVFGITLSIHNPGVRNSIFYQRMDVEVSYHQQPLATTTVSEFFVGAGDTWNRMDVKLSSNGVQFNGTQQLASGSASFNVRLYAGYWIGGSSMNRVWSAVEETCYDEKIGFSSDQKVGKLLNGPMQCTATKTWY
ncbi:hypothetical protein K2173_014200 [Erythroxylum novogranatense]|uniref:Late embryogenesis abundant protein LEA-2 subgroup domain-containing protein n=1 Tax=Erythroxylum novogranatense TaxID=1862640 RepID=A0AAV8SEC8_9ROSI|nr:hypothetical protein K2173_014200 [Erythroxylum novogranatense]